MAKDQSSYFAGKHLWSETKDDLLSCYLTPYFQKVFPFSKGGIVYVDAFAGEGKFADGTLGSPLIALSKLQSIARGMRAKVPVQFVLAESNSDSRAKLVSSFRAARGNSRYVKEPIVCDDFQHAIGSARSVVLKSGCRPSTYFVYIDPFGVKDLRMDLLRDLPNPRHAEVLLNFNTIGFIRDACAALKSALAVPSTIEVADEALSFELPASERIARLTSCIGSEDWVDIVRARQNNATEFWEAEYQIARLFCKNAATHYRFVTNMPVKDMRCGAYGRGLIKYRMIHMTNNADGCVLMNDNMLKRNAERQTIQPGMFVVDVDGRDVEPSSIQRAVNCVIESLQLGEKVKMAEIAASSSPAVASFPNRPSC